MLHLRGALAIGKNADNPVVARLSGGLGNQLFQYAAARGIAALSGGTVALDVSGYRAITEPRRFALGRLVPEVPVVTDSKIDPAFRTVKLPAPLACVLPVVRENEYEFEPHVLARRNGVYLYGFWQSWRYFDHIGGRLRRELAGAAESDPAVVAVQVRRGDNLLPANRAVFGLCETAYYAAALDLMRARLGRPIFHIFSDDPDWCRATFRDPDVVVVSKPDGDAIDDLLAMARCRHHVIANSSFGWWGAWLGGRADSMTVAPIPWFNEAPLASDLLPSSWMRLHRTTGEAWPPVAREAPLVSVVILARNSASREAALASVRAQTYGRTELIIADDSTIGDGAALEAAVHRATGEWIAFLDVRDAWLPDKLEIELDAAHLTGAGAIVCRTMPVVGPSGMPEIYPPPGPPDCSLADFVHAGRFIAGISHTVVRRDLLRELGRFDPDWQVGTASPLLQRLHWHERTVRLWQRLVRSPLAYLG